MNVKIIKKIHTHLKIFIHSKLHIFTINILLVPSAKAPIIIEMKKDVMLSNKT